MVSVAQWCKMEYHIQKCVCSSVLSHEKMRMVLFSLPMHELFIPTYRRLRVLSHRGTSRCTATLLQQSRLDKGCVL